MKLKVDGKPIEVYPISGDALYELVVEKTKNPEYTNAYVLKFSEFDTSSEVQHFYEIEAPTLLGIIKRKALMEKPTPTAQCKKMLAVRIWGINGYVGGGMLGSMIFYA